MLDDFGESKVTVKKGELLDALRLNRLKHVELYSDAVVGYRDRLIEFFTGQLENLKAGKEAKVAFASPAPVNRCKDYDIVIKMLEMSTADDITVTQSQFQQFVMDDWGWSAAVGATNLEYSNSRRR